MHKRPYIAPANRKDGQLAPYQLVCALHEFKGSEDDTVGTFTGYGSIYDKEDLGGDVIVGPKPFKKFKLTKDKKVRILYHHNVEQPVGKFTPEQDEKGLWMPDAALVMDMPAAPVAYAGMKSGLLDGLSVGFDILNKGAVYNEDLNVRELTALELWEVSIVTFGMNQYAKIQSVKAANNITSKREFEDFLRENGFTKSQARNITLVGFKDEGRRRDADSDLSGTLELVKGLTLDDTRRDAAPVSGMKSLMNLVDGFTL